MNAVSFGSKEKLCEEVTIWQPACIPQMSSQKPVAMLYQLGQGRIGTNIYFNILARLLQCLPFSVVIEEIVETPASLRSSDSKKGKVPLAIKGFTPLVLALLVVKGLDSPSV